MFFLFLFKWLTPLTEYNFFSLGQFHETAADLRLALISVLKLGKSSVPEYGIIKPAVKLLQSLPEKLAPILLEMVTKAASTLVFKQGSWGNLTFDAYKERRKEDFGFQLGLIVL